MTFTVQDAILHLWKKRHERTRFPGHDEPISYYDYLRERIETLPRTPIGCITDPRGLEAKHYHYGKITVQRHFPAPDHARTMRWNVESVKVPIPRLVAFYRNEAPPKGKPGCGNPACLNPAHYTVDRRKWGRRATFSGRIAMDLNELVEFSKRPSVAPYMTGERPLDGARFNIPKIRMDGTVGWTKMTATKLIPLLKEAIASHEAS